MVSSDASESPPIRRAEREALNPHKGALVWFTGLSASGKTTLARAVDRRLLELGVRSYRLDGDVVREGLNADLGFSPADREENVRRITEVGRLMIDAGLVVVVAVIAPYAKDRAATRARFGPGEFFEVFVDTPLADCERRDPKGLYAKARAGEITHFTGIDSPYQRPKDPSLRLTPEVGLDEQARLVVEMLERADG